MKYLGVDIGGTSIKCGVVEGDKIIYKKSEKTPKDDVEKCIDTIVALCYSTVNDAGLTLDDVAAIGIGVPGTVDKNGVVGFAPNINWRNVDVRTKIGKAINKPIKVGKDSNCALIGEALYGAAKGFDNVAMVTIGTGVGTAFLCDGRLLLGNSGAAGEGGHVRLYYNGLRCSCGKEDCWELYASASALERNVNKELAKQRLLNSCVTGGCGEKINLIDFFAMVTDGDEKAIKILEEYRTHIVAGMVMLANIFRPEIILLGGGVSKQPVLINGMEQMLNKQIVGGDNNPQVKVKGAYFDNDAGLIGAAAFASDLAAKMLPQ